MNTTSRPLRSALYLLAAVMLVYFTGRIAGAGLFDNHWSFLTWQALPGWYPLFFTILMAAAIVMTLRWKKAVPNLPVTGLILFVGFILLSYDSFLYGNGFARVGQIAGSEHIVFRPFEFGSLVLTAGLYKLVSFLRFLLDTTTEYRTKLSAGVLSWKLFAYFFTGLSLLGAAKLACRLANGRRQRFLIFIIVTFGPQVMVFFGPVSWEPALVTTSTWFILLALKLEERFSIRSMLALWAVLAGGIVFHFSCVFLLPAAIYLTLAGRSRRQPLPLLTASLTLAGMITTTYLLARDNLELSHMILYVTGKNPHASYGLFSTRHLGDIGQVFLLVFPQAVVALFLFIKQRVQDPRRTTVIAVLLATFAGTIVLFMRDPIDSIVLDLPAMVAYLAPWSFLLALLLADRETSSSPRHPLLAVLAAIAFVLPLGYLPTYVRLRNADEYVTDYLDKHEAFYYQGCYAFRAAYFYQKDLDRATEWERKLPVKSPDYLNITGIRNLFETGNSKDALRVLANVKIQNPFWSEPRLVEARIQMAAGRYDLAKVLIDTCLLLEPYRREHLVELYGYWRDTKNLYEARQAVENAHLLFPNDLDIISDRMIINNRAGFPKLAGEDAELLLKADSTRPYPYLVKGIMAEQNGDPVSAVDLYRRFCNLGADSSDIALIRKRIKGLSPEARDSGRP